MFPIRSLSSLEEISKSSICLVKDSFFSVDLVSFSVRCKTFSLNSWLSRIYEFNRVSVSSSFVRCLSQESRTCAFSFAARIISYSSLSI